jgi:uncharacterized protein (DUF433 family)
MTEEEIKLIDNKLREIDEMGLSPDEIVDAYDKAIQEAIREIEQRHERVEQEAKAQ